MHAWKAGESVVIVDPTSAYCGQIGVVDRRGDSGGLWIKHEDGQVVYHPWGYDIVRVIGAKG